MTMTCQVVEVCAAVIVDHDGRFLLARRPPGKHLAGKWEFPGGKIMPGESREECIVREIEEELNLLVRAESRLATIDHQYPEKRVRLHFLRCRCDSAPIGPESVAGGDAQWFVPDALAELDMAQADRRFWRDNLAPLGREAGI